MNELKYKCFVVMQAYKMEVQGPKKFPKLENEFLFEAISCFPTKEDAQNYMSALIINIKREIKYGARDKENLNPQTSLDFLIIESEIHVPTERMKDRKWIIKQDQ